MHISIGLENNLSGRSIAWALGYPGCFAYGADGVAALSAIPQAVQNYLAWVRAHGGDWLPAGPVEIHLEDTWNDYTINADFDLAETGHEVEAWFRHDWKPLDAIEIAQGLKLLAWAQGELLDTVSCLSPQAFEAQHPGERWNIAGIIQHIGGAEWGYLDRLGLAFPPDEIPAEAFERLALVHGHFVNVFPTLAGVKQVVGVDGEFWSPRKVLRRAVWHVRDHTDHIRKLI